ncbi:MAG: hypothetical protein F6K28_51945, partial [Microcoleus sp. SIO2G3]|nr:hypothetical protein [Microcoleus sp. SIO2G3]
QTTFTYQKLPTSSISSQNIGLGLVIVGIIVIILAVWRYNQVFWQIEQSNYKPSRLMVWFTAGVVVLLGILSIPFLLLRNPSAEGLHVGNVYAFTGADIYGRFMALQLGCLWICTLVEQNIQYCICCTVA